MPYYRHVKAEPPESGTAYATVIEARDGLDPKVYAVTFISTNDEHATWTAREIARYQNGEYLPVPWDLSIPLNLHLHYAHLSIKIPDLIAYTKTEEHGIQDRQTRIKPGRYLEEYYSELFSKKQIADYIGRCKAENLTLKIARTAQEIVRVYIGGPSSCMGGYESRDKGDIFKIPELHPCCVYGDSDLGVAYTGDTDKAAARAVVWPDKQIYSRVYGDCATLRALLEASGYRSGSVSGARVRHLTDNRGVLMPYIDGIDTARQSGNWITLGEHGDISTEETRGRVNCDDPELDQDDPEWYLCGHCNQRYRECDGNMEYCDDCLCEQSTCDHCDTLDWQDLTAVNDGNSHWCENCIGRATVDCAHEEIANFRCGIGDNDLAGSLVACEELWCEAQEFTRDEQAEREHLHVTHLCREHAKDVQGCAHCGHAFDDRAMVCPACGLSVRCANTYNLFVHFERPYIEIVPVLRDCTYLESPF